MATCGHTHQPRRIATSTRTKGWLCTTIPSRHKCVRSHPTERVIVWPSLSFFYPIQTTFLLLCSFIFWKHFYEYLLFIHLSLPNNLRKSIRTSLKCQTTCKDSKTFNWSNVVQTIKNYNVPHFYQKWQKYLFKKLEKIVLKY